MGNILESSLDSFVLYLDSTLDSSISNQPLSPLFGINPWVLYLESTLDSYILNQLLIPLFKISNSFRINPLFLLESTPNSFLNQPQILLIESNLNFFAWNQPSIPLLGINPWFLYLESTQLVPLFVINPWFLYFESTLDSSISNQLLNPLFKI